MKTRDLKITTEQLRLIAEIDEFKGSWKVIKSLAPERLAVLKRVATMKVLAHLRESKGQS